MDIMWWERPKITETIFENNLFDVIIEFLVWPMPHLLTWRRQSNTRGRSSRKKYPSKSREMLWSETQLMKKEETILSV